jgi:hypothetical protein
VPPIGVGAHSRVERIRFHLVLLSFVYAAAVTHVLSTAGEIIIASKRIRLSWF